LVAASAAVVIGFQSVLFSLFTQVYAGSEGFLPKEPRITRLLEKLSLERGLILGALIGLAGLAGLIFSVLYWHGQGFHKLNYEHSLRLMIPSVTALMVSCQVILGTFFLSILGIKHTRHPVTVSAPSVPDAVVNHVEQPAAAPRL
ncbi:MAG: glycosyltransferase family 2 protein, partial [Streptosporangiaceae bacterium]